jgi:hypothetical protein
MIAQQHNNTTTQQHETTHQHTNTSNGGIRQTLTNHNVINPYADPRESGCAKNAYNQRFRHADRGIREEENNQRCASRKTLGMVECKSAQQAAAREESAVQECESAQQAAARE